jgi:predicted neuraminidase
MSLSIRGSGDNTWLIAGTYGRGAYRINISGIKQGTNEVSSPSASNTFTKLSTNVVDRSNSEVSLNVNLENGGLVDVKLYDYLGREIKTLYNGYVTNVGVLPLELSSIAAGKYFVVTTANGMSNSLQLTVF